MTLLRAAPVLCAALIAAAFSPSAQADDWNRKTVITFSQPVETPGIHMKGWAVLPAGTYVFKILDSKSDRHIVQIFNQDETVVYATVLAIPNYRLRATDKTVLTFRETPPGEPQVLRAWFYPGHNFGEEFVYPKAKALELAKVTKFPVLYTPVEIEPEVASPITSPDEPVVVQLKQAPVLAVNAHGRRRSKLPRWSPRRRRKFWWPEYSSGNRAAGDRKSVAADRAIWTARFGRSLRPSTCSPTRIGI